MSPKTKRKTDAMIQYDNIKEKYPDTIVFFQLGDFYETFYNDARIISKVLNITLTSRGMGVGNERIPLAGVPVKSIDTYLKKLVNNGHKIVIVDQLEDARKIPSGRIVKRGVTRVVTPGTIYESSILDDATNNFLLSLKVNERQKRIGISLVDISTGEFLIAEYKENVLERFIGEFTRFSPKEIIISDVTLKGELQQAIEDAINLSSDAMITKINETFFNYDTAREILMDHFEVKSLAGYGCDSMNEAIQAAGAVISHLKFLKPDFPSNLKNLKLINDQDFLVLDSNTQRNLEVIFNAFDGRTEGSLCSIFTDIQTSMGVRLLRRWLLQPLLDKNKILNRLNTVEFFVERPSLRDTITALLGSISDFQRLISRIKYKSVNGRDFIALKNSIESGFSIQNYLTENQKSTSLLQRIVAFDITELREIVSIITTSIREDPPVKITDGGVIKPSYNDSLNELYALKKNQKSILENIELTEQNRTSFNIKLGYNSVHGYYIEATKAQLRDAGESAIPDDYTRRQTLVNAERFITPQLKEIEEKILNVDERITELEYKVFCEIRDEIESKLDSVHIFSDLLSELDVLLCFAYTAVKNKYCKPQFCEESIIHIINGRHAVVEQIQKNIGFIPNSVLLNDGELHIITGPNMSGKCVVPDTLIFSDKGILPIESFKPKILRPESFNDLDISVMGIRGISKTSHFYYDGFRSTKRITTRRGYVIEGTYNHPVLVRKRSGEESWKSLGDIKSDDYLILKRKNDLWGNNVKINYEPPLYRKIVNVYPLPTKLTNDLAYLLGLLVGDGTLTYKNSFGLCTADLFIRNEFIRINKKIFNYIPRLKPNKMDIFVYSKYIRDFLKFLGLKYSRAHEKMIPRCILEAPKSIMKSFIQGLFDTDGYIDKRYGNIEFSSSSKKLSSALHIILLNWGIVSTLKSKKTLKRPSHEVKITGLDAIQFNEDIGFRLERKKNRSKFSSSLRMTNVDSIPYLDQVLLEIKERYLRNSDRIPKHDKLKYNKSVSSIYGTYIPNKRNISYHKLRELIDYCKKYGISCNELEKTNENYYFYDKISKFEDSESEVYDFCIPEGHSFVGNGIINHNSTLIRQTALIVLMAQTGSWVPADSLKLGIVDKIFTRVGAFDRLAFGQSTFMLEMIETAHILHNATSRSLIILDEVGRGTSTFDGLSLAWAIAEQIVSAIKCKTLFATHYHQLSELESTFSEVKNFHLSAKERNGKLLLLYKLQENATDHSFGISVAKMAGVPKSVILNAQKKLLELESTSDNMIPPSGKKVAKGGFRQLSLEEAFSQDVSQSKYKSELKELKFTILAFLKNYTNIDVNYKTPIEALKQLEDLIKEMKNLEVDIQDEL